MKRDSEEEVYQLVGTVQANPLEQKISDEITIRESNFTC